MLLQQYNRLFCDTAYVVRLLFVQSEENDLLVIQGSQ